jgi:hypothetical protein
MEIQARSIIPSLLMIGQQCVCGGTLKTFFCKTNSDWHDHSKQNGTKSEMAVNIAIIHNYLLKIFIVQVYILLIMQPAPISTLKIKSLHCEYAFLETYAYLGVSDNDSLNYKKRK